MPDNEIISDESHEQTMPETAKEKFERERLTRRQALKRFGMTSAMTVFALFSVDDLAHMVGNAMQQQARDNKIAGQIAQEFQQAGVAFADGGSIGSGCLQYQCNGASVSCQHCANQLLLDDCYCDSRYGQIASPPYFPNPTMYQHCSNQAQNNYNGCACCWCPNNYGVPPNNTCPPISSMQPPQGCGC